MSQEKTQPKDGAVSLDEIASEFSFELPTQGEEETIESRETLEIDTSGTTTEDGGVEEAPKELVIDTPPPTIGTASDYGDLVKSLIDNGTWEDAEIEKEDGTTVKLSDYSDITKEEYLEVLTQQRSLREAELDEKYIKADKVDDEKRRLANIVLNGGDIKELFASPQELVKPFSEDLGWDLDNENHQASVVYQNYIATGMSEDEATLLTEKSKRDLTLDQKAKKIVDYHQKNWSNRIKEKEANFLKEKQDEVNNIKEFSKSIAKEYRDNYNNSEIKLSDTEIKNIVDIATRENSNGDFIVDEIYNKTMKDPKEAAELLLFLTDKDKYLKMKTFQARNKTNVDVLKKIKVIPKGKEKQTGESKTAPDFTFELPSTK